MHKCVGLCLFTVLIYKGDCVHVAKNNIYLHIRRAIIRNQHIKPTAKTVLQTHRPVHRGHVV